jgi:hypothetical protein
MAKLQSTCYLARDMTRSAILMRAAAQAMGRPVLIGWQAIGVREGSGL